MDFSPTIIAGKAKRFTSHPAFPFIIIFVFSLIGIKAFFHEGYYTSHDGWHQLVRLYHLDQALRDGQFPVRWAGEALKGYGYPLFYFTYQLPFYFSEIFFFLGFTLWDAIKITYGVGYFLSGVTMYFFAKTIWGKWGGFISSIIYLWAPYRFSVLFVRGSLGEHLTYIFIPLIFWGLWRLAINPAAKPIEKVSEKNKLSLFTQHIHQLVNIIIIAIGLSGVILSHAMMLQLILIPVLIFGIFLLINTSQKISFAINSLLAGILGFGTSSYYLIPALYAKNWVKGIDQFYLNDHLVTLKQLLYSPWGVGFSMPGINDGMSFQIGIPQWLIVCISLLLVLFSYIHRRTFDQYLWKTKLSIQLRLALALLFIFAVTSFLMLEQSRQVWESLRHYITLDFPWRYLTISTFTTALLAGFPLAVFTQLKLQKSYFKSFLITTYSVSLILLAIYANRNHIRVNLYELNPMQYVNASDTSNTWDEYAPKAFTFELLKLPQPDKVTIQKGSGKVTDLTIKSNRVSFKTQSQEELTVKINQAKYPGWVLMIDNQKTEPLSNGNGIWEFQLKPGDNTVQLILTEPLLNKIANSITVVSILTIIGGIWHLNNTRKLTKKQK